MSDQATTQTIRIVIDARSAKDGADDAKRAMQGIEQQTSKMGSALDRMEKKLSVVMGGFKTFALAAAVAWATSFAAQAMSAAASLDELAEQTGVTSKGLQALQFSAVQNGVKLEQLETGVAKFNQKIGEAAGGSKELIDSLNGLGVTILDTNGRLRPTEKQLQNIATAILAIDDPAKRAAASVEWFGKAGSKFQTVLKDMSGGLDDLAAKAGRAGAMISSEATDRLDKLADAAERSKLSTRALFAEAGAGPLTAALEGINTLFAKLAGYLRSIRSDWSNLFTHDSNAGAKLGLKLTTLEKEAEESRTRLGKISGTGLLANAQRNREQTFLDARTAAIAGVRAELVSGPTGGASTSDPDNIGVYVSPKAKDGSNPAVKGAGDDIAKRIGKLLGDSQLAAEYGAKIAEAAKQGSAAVEELEARYKATKAAQDAYGESAKANAPAVALLADKIYDLGRAADKAKNLTEFRIGTEAVNNDVQLLEAEVRLANELPEIRARELAIIKVTQEAKKKGLEDSREDIEARIAAVTQQDLLKQKIEETKKASDMWLEPVKGALQSIQGTAADAWQSVLESGKFSFQSLGDIFKKTVTRMAAEFLALATVRPVMSVLIQGATSMGFMSGGQAASLGYSGGGGGGLGGMSSLGGGGGLGSMFGGSSMFRDLGHWMNSPITGGGIDNEIANWSTYGTPAQDSMGGLLGNTTWAQGIGAAAGIGMGAYQLATSKSTAGTIGGIGSMAGGIISMLPIPGAQIAGPLISMASALLPSLFGGEEYKWDPLAGANARFDPGAGGYSMSESQQLGGKGIGGQYGNVAGTIDALFKATGGKVTPGMAMSGSIWNNQREGTTSTYVISPTQGSLQLSEGSGDQSAAVDRMIAKMFYMTATTPGALNGVSPTLMTALGNKEPTSTAAISSLNDLVKAYDNLGKVTGSAETALKKISDSFEAMTTGATEYGLALAPIEAEQKKQTTRMAQDFVDNLLDPMAVSLRAFADEKKDILASLEYISANTDVHVDMARANEALLRKEAALKEQLYGGAVAQLEDAIKRMSPGGALSNLDPSTTLAGMKASYRATYAQAAGGDNAAISRLAGEGTDLASYSKSYFAGSPEYNALRDEILANLRTVQGAIQGPVSTSTTPLDVSNPAITSLVQQLQVSNQLWTQSQQETAELKAQMTKMTNLVSRLVTNMAS